VTGEVSDAHEFEDAAQFVGEPGAWWALFIEHFAALGVDRRALNDAVVRFRDAQDDLNNAIKK